MKILIVDDDVAILKITRKFLELNGFEVVCCENALDAIQTLGDLTFDILITDATMPAHSGFDLIRSIRKTPELNYLSIAMLTGRSEKSDIEQAVGLGVQDYIVKPIDPDIFIDKVQKLSERHKKKKLQKPNKSKANAEMLVPVTVSRITDIGVSIESPHPLAKGTIVTIDLELLKEAGLQQNRFKSIFNTQIASNRVMIELLLLDITTKEQNILAQLSKSWLEKQAS